MVTALTLRSGAVTLPWEIDENLMRADLSATEMAEHLARREELWERRKKLGGATCTTKPQHQKQFAADTASQTGVNKSTVTRATSRAKAIPSDIRDTIKGMEPGREFGSNSLQNHWIPPATFVSLALLSPVGDDA